MAELSSGRVLNSVLRQMVFKPHFQMHAFVTLNLCHNLIYSFVSVVSRDVNLSDDMDLLTSYITHRPGSHGPKYDRVELHWPFKVLREGIVLVDSPGVGESDELTTIVKDYMPNASAFIYVINTPNAGGIHPDRVSKK